MPIKNFSQYLVEEEREVYFTFGRMNPPTIGHGKVMDTLASKSGKYDYKVYLSQSQNPKKDPLTYEQKVKHVRKMFPKHARQVIMDKGINSVFDIAVKLYDQGYTKINMVVGQDRVREFEVLLNKYNGQKARHGFYNFKKINVISAGARDPDATGVEGMSASKQRENVAKNDFVTFAQGVPKSMSNDDARKLFNDVRKGMGLKEEVEFKNHIELESVSETRERYVSGDLFEVGDTVLIKESEEVGVVSVLGANYVIIESNGRKLRKWLDAIELVEKSFSPHMMYDPKTGKSYKAEKPEDHERMSKMGYVHKTPKKKFREMFEDVSQSQINDLEKFADRLLNKFDVDIEFTRHFADRMNDPRNKPSISISELESLFKKMADNKGKKLKKYGNKEAILKDMQTDLNLPIVINWKNGEFEVVHKTIMRKKAFKSPDPEVKYESVEEGMFANIDPKLDRLIDRWVNRPTFKKAIRLYLDMRKEKPGRAQQNMVRAAKVVGIDYRNLEQEFHKLIKQGKLPKHLAFRKDLVSEENDPVADAKDDIKKEKESDKKKHDSILDRARIARAKQKNFATKP